MNFTLYPFKFKNHVQYCTLLQIWLLSLQKKAVQFELKVHNINDSKRWSYQIIFCKMFLVWNNYLLKKNNTVYSHTRYIILKRTNKTVHIFLHVFLTWQKTVNPTLGMWGVLPRHLPISILSRSAGTTLHLLESLTWTKHTSKCS